MAERPRLGRRRPTVASEPDLAPPYKAAIEAAIRWAWSEVLASSTEIVDKGQEEEITTLIQHALNENDPKTWHRRAPGLHDFETVDRGAKVVTADGRIEKQPDLVFRPIVSHGVRNRSHWGLFVECKIISHEKHHSPDNYCDLGLAKFCKGEYAAQMSSGAMVAYVRDGSRPYDALTSILKARYETAFEQGSTEDSGISRHERSALDNPCVEIIVSHLWLDARLRR